MPEEEETQPSVPIVPVTPEPQIRPEIDTRPDYDTLGATRQIETKQSDN